VRRFRDRVEAGRELGERLAEEYARRGDVLVLALPRGGVVVGREVAAALGAPLDVLVVRKLGFPGQDELAMGAIASGGARVLNEELLAQTGLSLDRVDAVAARELAELERREELYRGRRPPPEVSGKTVIVVDDGLATGSTMLAAVEALRAQDPAQIVVAVPTAPPQTCSALERVADEVVCLRQPYPFYAVGLSYEDFSEVGDDEVRRLLSAQESTVTFNAEDVELEGTLVVPEAARGVVVFAHGSGSSRFSPRNRYVASVLNEAGIGTLLIDLLSAEEEELDLRTRALRFDVELLAQRLVAGLNWMAADARTGGLAAGIFGASTGAAAALLVAARRPRGVAAVVSRGGRPDLAGPSLAEVRAPTLLIVGSLDHVVLDLNREVMARMTQAEVELETVTGATHLFEEPGTLERVAELARDWFGRHLGAGSP
jgi:putative phosphoribosyl transferase